MLLLRELTWSAGAGWLAAPYPAGASACPRWAAGPPHPQEDGEGEFPSLAPAMK